MKWEKGEPGVIYVYIVSVFIHVSYMHWLYRWTRNESLTDSCKRETLWWAVAFLGWNSFGFFSRKTSLMVLYTALNNTLRLDRVDYMAVLSSKIDRRWGYIKTKVTRVLLKERQRSIIMTTNGATLSLSDYRNLRRPTISSSLLGFLFQRTQHRSSLRFTSMRATSYCCRCCWLSLSRFPKCYSSSWHQQPTIYQYHIEPSVSIWLFTCLFVSMIHHKNNKEKPLNMYTSPSIISRVWEKAKRMKEGACYINGH